MREDGERFAQFIPRPSCAVERPRLWNPFHQHGTWVARRVRIPIDLRVDPRYVKFFELSEFDQARLHDALLGPP